MKQSNSNFRRISVITNAAVLMINYGIWHFWQETIGKISVSIALLKDGVKKVMFYFLIKILVYINIFYSSNPFPQWFTEFAAKVGIRL